jgi:hypothetical protein
MKIKKEKIYLAILPYWDPMIPPMGIGNLKAFLQNLGYEVKTEDLIVKKECLEFYDNYFETLRKIVPKEKQGNFNNIGHDVLQNHMMAYQHNYDNEKYEELVSMLIYNHYYVDSEKKYIKQLNTVVDDFYIMLREYVIKQITNYQPDVFGVTAFKCTLPASLFALKLAKELNPAIKTIMGGGTFNESHAPDSPSFEALLNVSKDYLDKIFIGPGELLFQAYLEKRLDDSQRVYTKADIGGKILGFESQLLPDFSDLDLNKYPCLVATSSASCIYECSFCTAKKVSGAYRKKNPVQVVAEMIKMYEKYGHQLFFMTDALINPVLTDISKEFIKSGTSLYYDSYFKVDNQSADIMNTLLWRKGGLYRVRIGTESGSQRVLNEMDKGITPEQIKATVSALAYAGIKTTTYWVIGHPDETEQDFQLTLDLIEELKDDIFQAECNYFLYHFSNQVKADKWAQFRMPLYPDWANKMLVFKHWTLNYDPLREETFKRVHRFETHCKKLGIPNPYSYREHYDADIRWQKLHENAVPGIMEFMKRDRYIDENQTIQIPSLTSNKRMGREKLIFDL